MSTPTLNKFRDGEIKPPQLKVKFNAIPKTKLKSFTKLFPSYQDGLVKSEPGGFVIPPYYCENAERIYRIKPREDDVWLLTFPKSGTTWTSELLWQVLHDCNFEEAAKFPLHVRSVGESYLNPEPFKQKTNPSESPIITSAAKFNSLPSPRIIRPHLPFFLLPPKLLDTAKVVYVARNPKDVIVSAFYHHKLFKTNVFTGDLETFAQHFMNNEVAYTPYFPHVINAWNKRHHPNMHFMFYEDMKQDLRGEIEKVAKFLDKTLSEDQLTKLTEHLRFDNFEKNPSVNLEIGKKLGIMNEEGKFVRKGKTGDWKNHFSPELNRRIDDWIERNLEGTDLKFVTELEHQD